MTDKINERDRSSTITTPAALIAPAAVIAEPPTVLGLETAPHHTMVSSPETDSSSSTRIESSSPTRDEISSAAQDNTTSTAGRESSILAKDEISSAQDNKTSTPADNVVVLNVQGEPADSENGSEQSELTGRARSLANLRPQRKGDPALNPRGRPKKDLDLAKLAQQHAEKAVRTLAQCLEDDTATWPAKVSAARELLHRGFGRAPQSLNVEHKLDFSASFEAFVRELGDRRAGRKPAEQIEHDADEAELE